VETVEDSEVELPEPVRGGDELVPTDPLVGDRDGEDEPQPVVRCHHDAHGSVDAEGLHSCPQMAWSVYRQTVADVVSPPEELILFCGMSIGFEDATTVYDRIDRAPLAATVAFIDG